MCDAMREIMSKRKDSVDFASKRASSTDCSFPAVGWAQYETGLCTPAESISSMRFFRDPEEAQAIRFVKRARRQVHPKELVDEPGFAFFEQAHDSDDSHTLLPADGQLRCRVLQQTDLPPCAGSKIG